MRFYFAGAEGSYKECLEGERKLMSYYYLNKKKKIDFNFEKEQILLDSGGFQALTMGIDIEVKDYANFINKHKIKLAFELDVGGKKKTLYNRDYLLKNTRATIIPIYHIKEYEEKDYKYLFDMVDNFEYISIGGIAGSRKNDKKIIPFLDYVFKQVKNRRKIHGLGVVGVKPMLRYPFYSVDFTSWMNPAIYGQHFKFKNGILKRIGHTTPNINKFMDSKEQIKLAIKEIKLWEKYLTKLWKKRGITWDS